MEHDLLGGEDAAWLHMEDPTNPMIVNAVLELAAPLSGVQVHALVESLASNPRFRARLTAARLPGGSASWALAPDFDLREHIEHVHLDAASDGALRAFIGSAVSKLLVVHRPLWRVHVIDRPGVGTALLVRVHHAIADGFGLLGVLLSLCDAGDAVVANPTRPASQAGTLFSAAKALRRLVMLPPDPKTLLKGALGSEKRVAWSEPLVLEDVKRVARTAKATVNDVLVATVAGALRRYLARRGDNVDGLEVRAMVPVNLRRSAPPTTLGNFFGLVLLGLHVGVTDPLSRLMVVRQRMDLLKATPEAAVAHALLSAMGRSPRLIEDMGVTFFGNKASLVLTNVPGPRLPVKLAGVPVSRMMFWVPQSGRMGLGISIFSYAGAVTIGVLSDAGLVPDPDTLATDLHAEFACLGGHVREHVPTTAEGGFGQRL